MYSPSYLPALKGAIPAFAEGLLYSPGPVAANSVATDSVTEGATREAGQPFDMDTNSVFYRPGAGCGADIMANRRSLETYQIKIA